jgi:hypothetical protein
MRQFKYIVSSLVILLFFSVSPSTLAEVYKYTDSSGKVHYVDDPSKIPDEYQDQAKNPHNLPNIVRDQAASSESLNQKGKSKEDIEFEKYLAQVTIAPFKDSADSNQYDETEKNIEFTINNNSIGQVSQSGELTEEQLEMFNKLQKWALPLFIFGIIITLLQVISFWILLDRAHMPGWGVIIPIYNLVLLSRLAGFSGWWTLWIFVPFIGGIIWVFSVHYCIAIRNGRSSLFAVGNVFLPFIFTPIMAFSKN